MNPTYLGKLILNFKVKVNFFQFSFKVYLSLTQKEQSVPTDVILKLAKQEIKANHSFICHCFTCITDYRSVQTISEALFSSFPTKLVFLILNFFLLNKHFFFLQSD